MMSRQFTALIIILIVILNIFVYRVLYTSSILKDVNQSENSLRALPGKIKLLLNPIEYLANSESSQTANPPHSPRVNGSSLVLEEHPSIKRRIYKVTHAIPEANWEPILFDPSKNLNLTQDDPKLLEYMYNYHLYPPIPIPYNLRDATGDPAAKEKQHLEILKLLKGKRNGIFIEAGANDGEFLSTTLVLERDYGWTGILVEPDSTAFGQLKMKGRKSWLSDICLSVSKRPEKVQFIQNQRTSTWSKLAKISKNHRDWNRSEGKEVTAKCFPFYSLVAALNMTVIDYFSLDIEGAELAILRTIPFESVLIRTMSIEFDHVILVPGADEELRELMYNKSYVLTNVLTGGNANDYIYAHSSILT